MPSTQVPKLASNYQTNPYHGKHSNRYLMRLTLMVLSILRTPLVVRKTFIAVVLALCAAVSSTCLFAAAASHTHRRTASSHTAHHRHHAVSAKTARHTVHRSSRRTARVTRTARRRVHHSRSHARRYASYRQRHPEARTELVSYSRRRYAAADETSGTDARDGDDSDSSAAETRVTPSPLRESTPASVRHATGPASADEVAEPQPDIEPSTSTISAIPMRNSTIVAMAPLRGSMESLIRQNDRTDADNLERIQDDADLRARIASGALVPVPVSDSLTINGDLPQIRRYCRPWTAKFLKDLSRAHEATFHRPFEVSSAVRTVEYQMHLMRVNGNAAPALGDIASPHLTGATIDIAKHGMSRDELYWMRDRLNALQNQGKIDVEEEFRQACFHITVYKSYIGAGPVHRHHPQAAPAPDESEDADNPPAAVASGATN